MNDIRKAELLMLIRVAIFGVNHPLAPASAKATEYYTTVTNAKDVVLASGINWDEGNGAFRAATSGRHAVVDDLRGKLKEISLTAKALHRAGVHPGIDQHFRMPSRAMQDLRNRAGAFAATAGAEDVKPAFIAHDCAPTFIGPVFWPRYFTSNGTSRPGTPASPGPTFAPPPPESRCSNSP